MIEFGCLAEKVYLTFNHSLATKTITGIRGGLGHPWSLWGFTQSWETFCGLIPDENWNKQHNTQVLIQTKPLGNSICLMKNCGAHLKMTEYIISFKVATSLCDWNHKFTGVNFFERLRGSDLSHQSPFLTTPPSSSGLEEKIQSPFMFRVGFFFVWKTTEK